MIANPRTCPHCGAANVPDAVFCSQCGRGMGAPPPSRNVLIAGLVAALLVGIVAALVVSQSLRGQAVQRSTQQSPVVAPAPEPVPEPAPEPEPTTDVAPPSPPEGPVASEQAATDLVMQQPAVQEWLVLIEEAQAEGKQRRALVEVTEETDTAYIVHVFESVEDEEPGHTATFGWYNVSKADGAITDANAP